MKQHNWIKLLLLPFSCIYGLVTSIRNILYNRGFLSTENPSQFVISVGNLTVGGTGKTPMIEHLVGKLNPQFDLSILSRGYGRKTTGLLFANTTSTALEVGDEPLQFFKKYGKSVIIVVCEDRVTGANAIAQRFPKNNVLLLDDAFQHRAIGRNINILLNDFNRPFYEDYPFPAGRLRETRSGAKRADAIVVTKCPDDLADDQKKVIIKKIQKYSLPTTPIFFAQTQYGQPITFDNKPVELKKVKLIVGIASPLPFISFVKAKYQVIDEIIYPDHHNYTRAELEGLIKNLKSNTFVLTTEKDMVKLKPLAKEYGKSTNFAFIPIRMDFGGNNQEFDDWMERMIVI